MLKTAGIIVAGLLVIAIFCGAFPSYWFIPVPIGLILIITGICLCCGIFTVNPNQAYVLTLWGQYKGTVKKNG